MTIFLILIVYNEKLQDTWQIIHTEAVLPNSELQLNNDIQDDLSYITQDTYLRGKSLDLSTGTRTKKTKSDRRRMSLIDEPSSSSSSSAGRRSMTSHQLKEPSIPNINAAGGMRDSITDYLG